MSNLQNTSRLPLRATMTNKWKSQAVTNDLLERKTRALEGGLNKLKFTTQKDQTKSITDTHRQNKKKEIPQAIRDKPTVNLFSTKSKQMVKCGQCEKVEAKTKCLECLENYCTNCFSQFHLRGALQRHHCVPLSTSQNKNQPLTTDTNLRESPDKQSNDNLQRKSSTNETEVINDKTNFSLFQQSFLQWRDNNINKSQRIQQKRGSLSPITDKIENSNKYQHANKNYHESFIHQSKKINLTKNDQPKMGVLINRHDSFTDNTNLNEPMIDSEPLNDDLSTTVTTKGIEIVTSEENLNADKNLEQERPITHVSRKSFSRPTSSSIKKDPIISRPNSTALVQQSLRSFLTAKSTDELAAIIDSQLILSRPTSSASEKLTQPSHWQSLQTTSNNIDVQPIITDQNTVGEIDLFDGSKIESAYRLNYSSENIPRVTSAKDQTATNLFCINSTTPTPRGNSPFSFSYSLYKLGRINSASSRDTADGGFFTDFLPRKTIPSPILPPPPPPPLPILECSTSNEWKHALENQSTEQNQTIPDFISLPKLYIRSLSRPSSKHSVTREEIHHRSQSQTDNNSRPGSSLSSTSLPISIKSSKKDFNISTTQSSAASSRKSSSSSTSTLKKSSSSTLKSSTSATKTAKMSSSSTLESSTSATKTTKMSSSSTLESSTSATKTAKMSSSSRSTPKPTIKNSSSQPESIIPITTEIKKEISSCDDPNDSHQESMNSLKDKSSSNVNAPESSNDLIKPNLIALISREENITENDLPAKKKKRRRVRRQTTTSDDMSGFRKLEFSMGVGLQWQEASVESICPTESISGQSSTVTTPRLLTPSNPINTKLAEQFQVYDDDDGRSSRTYQNMNDDECFNQLCQELCSELDTTGSDEDAILNDHIVKILRSVKIPYNEKDVIIIETKLRENETVHQPSSDNKLLIHE